MSCTHLALQIEEEECGRHDVSWSSRGSRGKGERGMGFGDWRRASYDNVEANIMNERVV